MDDELGDDPGKPESSESFNWPLAVWIVLMVPFLMLLGAMVLSR